MQRAGPQRPEAAQLAAGVSKQAYHVTNLSQMYRLYLCIKLNVLELYFGSQKADEVSSLCCSQDELTCTCESPCSLRGKSLKPEQDVSPLPAAGLQGSGRCDPGVFSAHFLHVRPLCNKAAVGQDSESEESSLQCCHSIELFHQ